MSYNPLVSISVLTYNSSKYILETLDSIKNQTYNNIDFIISDDCSTDNTVELCRKWVNDNSSRFVRTQILTVDKNTGVAANLNRAIENSQGEWLKGVAGDDLLCEDCIEKYVNYVSENPNIDVCFSYWQSFVVDKDTNKKIITDQWMDKVEQINAFNAMSAREQYITLLEGRCTCLSTLSAFTRKDIFDKYKYNELYKYMEDYPMWITLTKAGYRFHIIDVVTVQYRVHASLSNNVNTYFSPRYFSTKHLYFWLEKRDMYMEEKNQKGYDLNRKTLLINDLTEGLTNNKVSFFNTLKVRAIHFFVNKFTRFEI